MTQRPGDPLDDSTLERELETLVDVDPSPEFLARVRTRVADEEMGHRWRLFPRAWAFQPLLAAGIAGIVLAIVIPSWLRPEPPAVDEPRAAATSPAVAQNIAPDPARLQAAPTKSDEGAAPLRERRREAASGAREGRLQAVRSDAPPFAEVLVSEDEQRAFALLLTQIEQGRLPPLPAAVEQTAPVEPPALEIPQLVIEPLPQIAALE